MAKDNPSTEILKSKLLESEDLDQFIQNHKYSLDSENFKDYLYALIDNKGLKVSAALQMAQMSESYGYQLLNGKRQPSRDKVIQLAIGLGLSLYEANRLLKLSGKSELYVKEQRDAVFMFALNKRWSLYDVEALLLDRGLDCLIQK